MGLLSEDDLDYYLSQIGAYFAIMLRDNPDDTYKELYSHYDAVREHIQTLEKTNGWISVKDRLPEEYGNYLAVVDGEVTECTYSRPFIKGIINGWITCNANGFKWLRDEHITHWMPLPEPPKEE